MDFVLNITTTEKFIEIEYSGGRKNGRAVNWHRNGQVQWERTFKSDQLDGDSIRYDSEGNITPARHLQNGSGREGFKIALEILCYATSRIPGVFLCRP